ncbi:MULTISPECIES: PAS domain-containing hybrid sensor histidine kinase/response regulator [Rhodococcus]|uniref:PAS domain-containing hybrid sensor histidine kinase/response regulator n=1 Tax=Rhodococcus TaxID=1827 RepID=UPI001386711B|nr:PAS domain-containing hybrid sensor histidine kinase/response regulator [Rhodococcus aetherivorans]MBC2591639.1 response regulator [Rhodococcus aetherivorans]NCL76451.1 Sensor histidine kinase RcsC [Rhodococcus sp. YH1]
MNDETSARALFPESDPTATAHRAADWASTALGPIDTWPPELTAAVRTVVPSRVPMLLCWGPELVQIFNDAFRPLLGEKFPAAVAQRASECWGEIWDFVGALFAQAQRGEPTLSERMQLFMHRFGYTEETYWTFSYSPVRAADGTVAGIFVATTDVTEQVLAERRAAVLRELGQLSMTETDTADDACRAALGLLAGHEDDLPFGSAHLCRDEVTVTVAEFGTAPGAASDLPEVIARVAESGKAETVADLGRDGDTAVVLPLPVSAGGPAGSLVLGISRFRELNEQYRVFLDMVAVRVSTALSDAQAYEAERRRAAELAELDAAKSRFFENVSHEFRTPLTLLLGPLQTLLDEHAAALPPAQVDAVAAARRAALRLQRLVDMLLDVARGDAGRLDAHTEPTDIVAVTREAAELFRDAADRAGLALLVDVDNVPTRYVATDRAMWTHIVLNLLSNAMKFTPEGSVAVSLRGDGANLVLRVADTGTGIAEAERGKIFDRFYQIGDRSGRSREGSGIGLSLVAQFVAALGGSVSVDAVAPHGSVFTVTVPAVPSAQPAPRAADDVVASAGAAYLGEAEAWRPVATPGAGPREGQPRLLLVEDNADMRDHLVDLLAAQGWHVDVTADAESALERIRTEVPDLLLSDVMLPGRSGLSLLQDVRGDERLARLPVILLTARAGSESAVEGLRAGADDYVVKPFHPSELIARVRVHLEMSRLREALLAAGEREAASLRTALDTRSVTSRAVGLLMAAHRVDADTAFAQLSAMSQATNVKVRTLAAEIVENFTASLAEPGPPQP